MLSTEFLTLDAPKVIEEISFFIRSQAEISGLNGAIVSVSGGVDSAVVLALTVKALKSKKVRAITMPERDITPESDITDVMQLTDMLDVTCDIIDITPLVQLMQRILPLYNPNDMVSFGNIKARTRMIVAYHYANIMKRMVIGSVNKTELLTGYFTKYGDGAVDLMPMADLYKNQVRQLARQLNIPEKIIKKTPTAGLWPGQSDEEELGSSYDIIDLILYGYEKELPENKIAKSLDVSPLLVQRILGRVRTNRHKRQLPLILKLSSAT
jgi:NAD+ synthase